MKIFLLAVAVNAILTTLMDKLITAYTNLGVITTKVSAFEISSCVIFVEIIAYALYERFVLNKENNEKYKMYKKENETKKKGETHGQTK